MKVHLAFVLITGKRQRHPPFRALSLPKALDRFEASKFQYEPIEKGKYTPGVDANLVETI
jgi:hypothetical protein